MEPTRDEIAASICQRYSELADDPAKETAFPVGPRSAESLGYSPDEIDWLPASATESFAGVGNPLALGTLEASQVVLDLGCGAGMDVLLAARKVGPSGKVIGVDLTAAMVRKAQQNARQLGLDNAQFYEGDCAALPIGDQTIDVVISNGVFNLCFDKPRVVGEIYRVLRAGGRLLMADMILEDHVTTEKVQLIGSWSG